MKVLNEKIRLIYCVCRQAERSIDFAIRTDDAVASLQKFYSTDRKRHINSAISEISDTLLLGGGKISRIHRLLGLWAGWRWVPAGDLKRLRLALTKLLGVIQDGAIGGKPEMINLRMELYEGQRHFERMPFLGKSLKKSGAQTEHFGQNDFQKFQNIEKLCSS